jgi:hypothetical protein
VVTGIGHGTRAGFVSGLRAGYVIAAVALFAAAATAALMLRPDAGLAGTEPAGRDAGGEDRSGTAA